MSAIIVNVESDIHLKLATFIGELLGKPTGADFLAECNELAAKNDIKAIHSRLAGESAIVFNSNNASGLCVYMIDILINYVMVLCRY